MSNNNEQGFLHLILGIGILVVAIIVGLGVWTAISNSKRNHIASDMGKQIDAIHIPASLRSKGCDGGDGIDSGAQCEYVYNAPPTVIALALKNAGYSGIVNKYGNESSGDFRGGNPAILIQVSGTNTSTTLMVGADR